MTGQTPKYGIKYPTKTDKVKDIPTTMQDAATTTEAAITAGVNEMANKAHSISDGNKSAKLFDYSQYFDRSKSTYTFTTFFAYYQRGIIHMMLHIIYDYGSISSTPPPKSQSLIAEIAEEAFHANNNDYIYIPCVATTNGGKTNLSNKVCIQVTNNRLNFYTLDSVLMTGATHVFANFSYIQEHGYNA